MLLIFLVLVHTISADALSTLCNNNVTYISCSDMVSLLPDDACLMKRYKLDGDECASMTFNHSAQKNGFLGNVRLQAAAYNDDHERSIINVALTNISWTRFNMRFFDESRKNKRVMCRTFTIWDNVTVPNDAVLFYDCPWYRSTHSGRNFTFEYEMTKGDIRDVRKFNLVIPSRKDLDENTPIDKRKVFSYVDVTNTQMLQLRMQPLEEKYNVNEYKVEVFRRRSSYRQKQDVRMIRPEKGEMKFDYNTWDERGDYYFLISFISRECPEDHCTKTHSAIVRIGRKSNSLVIGMVGALVIITSFLYIVFVYNKRHLQKSSHQRESEKNVLFIYLPTIEAHNRVVLSLAEVLENIFKLPVLLDVNDIPKTENKDPLKWCTDAFERATHVVYIASPEKPTIKSVYRVYSVLLRFLHEEMNKTGPTKKIACVTFPYSTENVPDDLKVFRRFNLMAQFDDFVAYIKNNSCLYVFGKVFQKNSYVSDPLFVRLQEEVKKLSDEPKISKMPIQLVKPEIKITDESGFDDFKETTAERDSLILNENGRAYDIENLNLSGGGGPKEKTTDTDDDRLTEKVRFNIDEMNL